MPGCKRTAGDDDNANTDNIEWTAKKPKVIEKKRAAKKLQFDEEFSPLVFSPVPDAALRDLDGPVGTIERVIVKNFMCHSNMDFVFPPNEPVQFITGRNGSGKSAVLNAIILALGGKANLTGRNTNIRGFIQTGKQVADISVTLSNCGPEAYKPEIYGPRITIERRISVDGGGTYKIKGDGGNLVSQKKEELNNILHALNIQVDNPVCVLTQEASKNFITTKDTKKKYSFFIKATQLEAIWEQYEEADRQRQAAVDTLRSKEESCKVIESDVKKLKEDIEKLKALDRQGERIKELENEKAWAFVNKEKERVSALQAQKEKVEHLLEKHERSLKKNEASYAEYLGKFNKLSQERTKIAEEVDAGTREYTEKQTEREKLGFSIKAIKRKLSALTVKIEEIMVEIANCKKNIEEFRARSQQDLEKMVERRQKEIAKFERDNSKLQEQIEYIEGVVYGINKAVIEEKTSLATNGELMNSQIQEKTAIVSQLNMIRSSLGNQEYLFGRHIPDLKKRINTAFERKQFRKMPIGPIGLYIRVDNRQWAFAVEECLGAGLLTSFCCDNMEDRYKLQDIMKSVYGNNRTPSIIVSSFVPQAHDVSRNKVVSNNYETVYDVIEANNAVVLNCLIDQRSIENIVLIKGIKEAQNVMMDNPPRNCSMAYTADGDQIYPSPKYRYYSCRKKPDIRYLKMSYTAEDIGIKEREISAADRSIETCRRESADIKSRIESKENDLAKYFRESREMRKCIEVNRNKIRDLQVNEHETDVSVLEEDLRNAIAQKEKFESGKALDKQDFLEMDNKLKQVTECHANLLQKTQIKRTQMDQMLNDLQLIENKKEKALAEKQRAAEELKQVQQNLKTASDNITTASKNVEEFTSAALLLSNGIIETDRSPQAIEMQISELKNAVQQHLGNIDREALRRDYIEKNEKLKTANAEICKLLKMTERQAKNIDQRYKNFRTIRSNITMKVQYRFALNLKHGHYVGTLNFSHDNKSLDIQANPRLAASEGKSAVNSLSGGERSYLTVCLLLALYDAAEIPFHFLDEYDVFMDDINKDKSMDLMVAKAKEKCSDQFVFLSPEELSKKVAETAYVHRMLDPERPANSKSTKRSHSQIEEEDGNES